MIDPRFANAGGVPVMPGYGGAQQVPVYGGAQQVPVYGGAQQVPSSYHHHRHHRHHKNKGRHNESPLSRDESIHKVDHGQQQNEQVPFGGGYGVPYGVSGAAGFQQQQQLGGANLGFGGNQFQGGAGETVKHHRRHHRHHRHNGAEAVVGAGGNFGSVVPEQLIGQRSQNASGNEARQGHSPVAGGEILSHHRHHHHSHHHQHHSGGQAGFGQAHQSLYASAQQSTSLGADGYGHINDDLIFIERSDQSPHRQQPPPGYEYQGKIEVQGVDKASQGQIFAPPPPPPSSGPCPPGWTQMSLTAAPGGPCPSGGSAFAGQMGGPVGHPHAGLGGMGGFGGQAGGVGFGGVGPTGAAGAGGGLANLAASLPFPPQGQLIADYIVESTAGGNNLPNPNSFGADYSQANVSAFQEQYQGEASPCVTSRPTIFEVWQRRHKSQTREKSPSRSRSPKAGAAFDFERLRDDILAAIESLGQKNAKLQWTGHDGGTQTQIQARVEERKQETSAGEVRVIVQPIQPVFYMPRQTSPQAGQASAVQQQAAPHVVYVPRNVYVPVIKPIFVPRERIIIRPQVIHVARPVLVDRPVPVTQRPIIIDRERPVPVPVRAANQAQAGGSKVIKEEYVYRDNLPVAYGGRCPEVAGGVNYGYMPTQAEHQYAAGSSYEASNGQNQFQQSYSGSNLNFQQGGNGFQGQRANLARANSASAANLGQFNQEVLQQTFAQSAQAAGVPPNCPTQIEVLDATVNPFWQKTDQSSLVRRYGRPAYDIVQRTDQVEQQMYSELRQRSSSGDVQRSASSASYGSGSGLGLSGGGTLNY